MRYSEYNNIIKCDLNRYGYGNSFKAFLKVFFTTPEHRVVFYMRTCDYLKENKRRFILCLPILIIFYFLFSTSRRKYGIFLALGSKIGKGLYINHFGCVGISKDAIVGKNLTIFAGAMIAFQGRGKRTGHPIIGDNVFISTGAKVIGNVKIGNNVVIGANAVVLGDLADNVVAVGNPSKIISRDNKEGLCTDVLEE